MDICQPLSPAIPAFAQLTHEEKWLWDHGVKTWTSLTKTDLAGTKLSA